MNRRSKIQRQWNILLRRLRRRGRFFFKNLRAGRPAAISAVLALGVLAVGLPLLLILLNTGIPEGKAASASPASSVVASIPAVSSPVPLPSPSPTPIQLRYGAEADEVLKVQARLMELGFMDSFEPTNYYGSYTKTAVALFQRQHDLETDGIAGEATYSLLFSDAAQKYVIEKGCSGDDVSSVQDRLYQLGYLSEKSAVTGHFGDETDAAVRKFQTLNGVSADGKIGEVTLELLYSDAAKPNSISYGEESEFVKKYQLRLKTLAYLTTEPDGKYGSDTVAAVKQFQSQNALVVDGYLGPATRELLDSKNAQASALALGASGATVKNIQNLLVSANCLTSSSTTGYFGSLTDAAVRLFQSANSLTVDGKVGPKTLSLLTSGAYQKASAPVTSGTGGSVSNGASAAKLLAVAKTKIGSPYVRGAKGPNKFDCSGFVYWCLNQIGVKQSYLTSLGWRTVGKYVKITSYDLLRPGDILVFYGHVAIVVDSENMIDAESKGIDIRNYSNSKYWKSKFICAWRIF